MNVLVASTIDEGRREDDFSYTVPGELVWEGFVVCDCPDCGCERAMAGMASSRGTTTFRVTADEAMTPDRYRQAFRDTVIREGWIEPGDQSTLADVDAIADYHRWLASQFAPGTELRRIPNKSQLRLSRR
jgi:hypothetical protein